MSTDEKITALWDYAVAHPDGFTRYDIERDIGWDNSVLSRIANRLREILADDTVNLTASPQGKREAWLYELKGDLDSAGLWIRNRLLDTETRLSTMHAITRSLVKSTDGRRLDGRKSRIMEKALRRLREDLDDLHSGEAV